MKKNSIQALTLFAFIKSKIFPKIKIGQLENMDIY